MLLSILAQFFITASREVRLAQIVPHSDGSASEEPAPAELTSSAVTLLRIYGNMTFAGAETIELFLPKAGGDRW